MSVSGDLVGKRKGKDMLLNVMVLILGYLLGSIPSAYVITKWRKGIDIRQVGSHNMGAGNVMQEVGFVEGGAVAIVDIAKGAAAVFIAQVLDVSQPWVLGAGFTAMLGHNFPVYLGFKGGQGICTIIGVFSVLAPLATLITLLPLGAIVFITRHIFAAILITGPFLPLIVWLIEGSPMLTLYALAIVILLLFRNRHRLKEVREITVRIRK
jgi:glycerol-3-phosphate acyltransferase PlsY